MTDHTPNLTPIKQCTKCKEWKPATPEYFHRRGKFRLASSCKECCNAYGRRNTPPKFQIKLDHKLCPRCEEIKPATTEYFARHKLKSDGFNANCKECNRRYKVKNRKKVAEWTRRYYQTNKERIDQATRDYRQKTKDQRRGMRRAEVRRRQARKRNAEGTHTAADVERQYKAQKGRCYYCKVKVGKTYQVDHVIPLSRDGSNGPENIVIACVHCNESKGAKMPHEWPQGGRLL